jgi:two-component system chemotaxis response regulator CheB
VRVVGGCIFLAPGANLLGWGRGVGAVVFVFESGPPVHFCKPAVDPLFSSAAEVWGAWNMAIVLTGMGTDGTNGAAAIVAAGGSVIAQDEATSVVWGMPGSAAEAGVCAAVLPLEQIGPKVVRMFLGARS